MKIIKPSVEYWQQDNTVHGLYEHAAKCARVCYQNEPIRNRESGKSFLLRTIIKNGFKKDKSSHMSVLEHATVYLRITNAEGRFWEMKDKYIRNHYSRVVVKVYNNDLFNRGISFAEACITTNLRVLIENDWLTDLNYLTCNISQHIKRYTFSIITNIGVSRELNRHRCHSISEESTRYCNYSKDKFDNGLTFIIPEWLDLEDGEVKDYGRSVITGKNQLHINGKPFDIVDFDDNLTCEGEWLLANNEAEHHYLRLLSKGWKPQQAREILPLSLKTQVVHTAFEDDWKDFIALKSDGISGTPHPNIKVIADKIKELIEQM